MKTSNDTTENRTRDLPAQCLNCATAGPPPLPYIASKTAAAEVLLVGHPCYMPFSGSTEMKNIHWSSSCIEQAVESKPTVKTLLSSSTML